MLRQIYKGSVWMLLLFGIGACSNEQFKDEPVPGNTPIQLSGALTRATGDGLLITEGNPLWTEYSSAQFYLSARMASGNATYFSNMSMTVGNNQSGGRNNLNSQVYYPLGGTEINLYAHTGSLATGDQFNTVPLVSGTNKVTNDILFGKGTDETGTVVSGSSTKQIRYITFRHQMTKVKVKIEVADDVEEQKPTAINITFNNSAIVSEGNLNMLTGAVTAGAQDYTLTGSVDGNIHYLVPTGKIISGTNMIKSLKIDDYTATDEDLANLTIQKKDNNEDFILSPGLAYDLTFQIKRLKLVGIKLTLNPWDLSQGSSDWDYEPYKVALNITGEDSDDGYDAKKITKVVLKHTKDGATYQYIGERKTDSNVAFVTLPPDLNTLTGLKADLYIQEGLLIKDIEVSTTSDKLNITLGKHGLKKSDDGYYEITTPLQFALTMNEPDKLNYRLTRDIDMDNNPIPFTPEEFPSGALLDGNKFKILHLKMENASGLVPVNNGTLKNIYIASGTIKGNGVYMGGISGTNNGVIEGCVNEANIETTHADATVGGISGLNSTNGSILACLNTGNALKGKTVGGIVGENKNTSAGAVKACLNVGLLNRKTATNLGGICGTSDANGTVKVIDTCYWLTGTARKVQSTSDEAAIGHVASGTVADATHTVSDLVEGAIRSDGIVDKLSAAASTSWKFEMNMSVSSWPIPVPAP